MYVFTLPRVKTLILFSCAVLSATCALPSSAQQTRTNSSSTQAELHIRVKVERAVAHHDRDRNSDRDRDDSAVAYNLVPRHDDFSITEDVRPMLVEQANTTVRQEQVRITTVVLK